jgi:hypothetical protein
VVLRLLSAAAVDPISNDVAHTHAKTARTSIAFMALKLHQTAT